MKAHQSETWIVFTQGYIYTTTLKTPEDVLGDLSSLGVTTHVRGEELAFSKVGVNSLVDDGSSILLTEELKHESDGADSSDRVGDVLALNIRGRAVARFTHSEAVTNVGRRNETQRADKSGGTVGKDVTVKVGSDNYVVCGRLTEELVDHGVNNLLLDLNATVSETRLLKGCAGSRAEQAVGLRENVALVCDGDNGTLGGVATSAVPDTLSPCCDLTSHVGDTVAGVLGNALDGLGDLAVGSIVGLLLLDVKILGVLTDNDKVNGVGESGGRDDRLDGSDVCVKVEALAEADNGTAVALGGGGRRAAREISQRDSHWARKMIPLRLHVFILKGLGILT